MNHYILVNILPYYLNPSSYYNFSIAIRLPNNIIESIKLKFLELIVFGIESIYNKFHYYYDYDNAPLFYDEKICDCKSSKFSLIKKRIKKSYSGYYHVYPSGMIHGEYKFDMAKISVTGKFMNGIKEGIEIIIYPDGTKTIKEYFNGKPCSATLFNKNGTKLESYKIVDFRKNGIYTRWHEYESCQDKKSIECEYSDGMLCGMYRSWYCTGALMLECCYLNDKLHGMYRSWNTGVLMMERCYLSGKLHGPEKSWNGLGVLMHQITYLEGKKHNLELKWYDNAKLKSSRVYNNGKKIGMKTSWHYNGRQQSVKFPIRAPRKPERDANTNYKGELRSIHWYETGEIYSKARLNVSQDIYYREKYWTIEGLLCKEYQINYNSEKQTIIINNVWDC